VPVLLVPGNHERSQVPVPLLARHPGPHLLDHPRTVVLEALARARSPGRLGAVRPRRRVIVACLARGNPGALTGTKRRGLRSACNHTSPGAPE